MRSAAEGSRCRSGFPSGPCDAEGVFWDIPRDCDRQKEEAGIDGFPRHTVMAGHLQMPLGGGLCGESGGCLGATEGQRPKVCEAEEAPGHRSEQVAATTRRGKDGVLTAIGICVGCGSVARVGGTAVADFVRHKFRFADRGRNKERGGSSHQ